MTEKGFQRLLRSRLNHEESPRLRQTGETLRRRFENFLKSMEHERLFARPIDDLPRPPKEKQA